MKEKVVEPEIVAQSTPPTSVAIRPEDEQRIQRVVAECPVRPIRDWHKARKDKEYLRQMVSYFPQATSYMYTKYLYDVTLTTINNAFHQAGAKRGASNRYPNPQDIYGRAAFVAWAGGNWREYLAENLPLVDAKRPQPTPVKEPVEELVIEAPVAEPAPVEVEPVKAEPPAPAKEPATPPAPVEPPAPAEKPAPAAPDKPVYIAEIKLSATNPEILRILNWLETETAAEILDYTVYRPSAK